MKKHDEAKLLAQGYEPFKCKSGRTIYTRTICGGKADRAMPKCAKCTDPWTHPECRPLSKDMIRSIADMCLKQAGEVLASRQAQAGNSFLEGVAWMLATGATMLILWVAFSNRMPL